MASYKTGERLRSCVSTVSVLIIKVAAADVVITCGGAPMAREGEAAVVDPKVVDPAVVDAVLGSVPVVMGKRYEDEAALIEVLCVSAGDGPLAVNGAPLQLKIPKPLPASD